MRLAMRIAMNVLYVVGLGMFLWVDWRLPIAAMLFGWAMNLENNSKGYRGL